MVFASLEAFYEKAAVCVRLDRAAEREAALRMQAGDLSARSALIESYLPVAAGYVRHSKTPCLGLAVYCVQALESAVDSFNFLQDSETFLHRLNWHLRQAGVRYLVRDV